MLYNTYVVVVVDLAWSVSLAAVVVEACGFSWLLLVL